MEHALCKQVTEMRFFNRQFITYGELLCFLAVWTIGLIVIFGGRNNRDSLADGEVAANNVHPHRIIPQDNFGSID